MGPEPNRAGDPKGSRLLYAVLPARLSNAVTLVASLLFHGWGGPVFVA